ncbi:MAG: gluconate 2-dehydrogenase subunit 3 family protein [Nitrospira sp.]|nr:gluconate 2-dehydrogenase subunit 3 family protein [Nitrospira sp.]
MKTPAQPITRRILLKRMALIGGGATVVGVLGGLGWRLLNASHEEPLDAGQLARREGERPYDNQRWLTKDEYAAVAALAAVIIPTDSTGPGATEAGVAGQIDRMLTLTPRSHRLYAEGLLALDLFAEAQHGTRFAQVGYDHQVRLVEILDQAKQVLEKEPESLLARVERKFSWSYYSWMGVSKPAVHFLDRIVEDVNVSFYGSKVAWDWLGYDGPPFPNGYAGRMAYRCQQTA